MTALEFNIRYKDYLEEGHYGLDLHKEEVIAYLDEVFKELIQIPGFKYSQIKSKFNWYCFYTTGVDRVKIAGIEMKLKEIDNDKTN